MTDTSKRGLQAAVVVGVAGAVAVALVAINRPGRVTINPQSPTAEQTARPAATDKRSLIERHIRRRANDPESVQIQAVLYGPREVEDGVPTQLVRVQYREKNTFGALTFRDSIFRVEHGRDVLHGPREDVAERMAGRLQWSDDPAGP